MKKGISIYMFLLQKNIGMDLWVTIKNSNFAVQLG